MLLLILFGIVFIVVLLLLKIEVEVKILIKNGHNYSFIALRLLRGILRFRFNLSLDKSAKGIYSLILRKTDSKLDKETSLEEVFKFIKNNYKRLLSQSNAGRYLFSKTKVRNLSLDLEIGLGDAAQTAIISGAIIFIFSAIQSYVQNRFLLKPQALRVLPYFQNRVFNVDLDCIIHLRIGHIIIAGIRTSGRKFKRR